MENLANIEILIKPDEEESEAAEIFVRGILGQKEYEFLLDTGSAQTYVTFDDYTATLKCIEKNYSSGVFSSHENDLIQIPLFIFGPIIKHDLIIARTTGVTSNDPKVRNLIGMDFLKDYRIQLFIDQHRMTIETQRDPVRMDIVHDLIMDTKYHPYISVHSSIHKFNAVWDTGAGITLVNMAIIEQYPDFFHLIGKSIGIDSTGTHRQTPMYLMKELSIAGHVFSQQKVAGVDLTPVNSTIEIPMDMIVGFNILKRAHWWFDFPNKKWGITQ